MGDLRVLFYYGLPIPLGKIFESLSRAGVGNNGPFSWNNTSALEYSGEWEQ